MQKENEQYIIKTIRRESVYPLKDVDKIRKLDIK